jgi:alkylhydroperoxidase family enzyme
VLADWRTAPIRPELRETLRFLERMTLTPHELTPADAHAVLRAGVGDEALLDAVHICALFSMVVRLADALDFEVPSWETLFAAAGARLGRGYELLTTAAPTGA